MVATNKCKVLLLSTSRADYNGLLAVWTVYSKAYGPYECRLVRITQPALGSAGWEIGSAYAETMATLKAYSPELVVVLGDRRETLLVAAATVDYGLPLCQLHALEPSGAIHPDSRRREAISHLANHLHHVPCVQNHGHSGHSTALAAGAPGLYWVGNTFSYEIEHQGASPAVVACFHPTPGEEHKAAAVEEACRILESQGIVVYKSLPGLDPGAGAFEADGKPTQELFWYTLLKRANVLIGNSSSGIIEAASCGTWVVDVGHRQRGRPRSPNTYGYALDYPSGHGPHSSARTLASFVKKLCGKRYAGPNVYADPDGLKAGAEKIAHYLHSIGGSHG
jgi:GDP/UDP-N,N'-diacetylbacillosamine 2-epimerase (hydrolysing)